MAKILDELDKMEVSRVEQRSAVHSLVAEGTMNADILRRMKYVFGKHCLGRTAVNN